jgi:hemerythrin-like metal-binding protein
MMTKLEIFPWNDNFECGIEIIDEQHKQLVSLLNSLVSNIAFQSEAPTLDKILASITEYVQFHFTTEEAIWRDHFEGDVWATWHHQSHGDFIGEVTRISQEKGNKSHEEMLLGIVRFLTHWLAYHILDSDKRMAKVVLALPRGISLALAKEAANEEMTGTTKVLIETLMNMYDRLADGTVQMSREIHRRKQAEEELTQANQAVQAISQAKSAFLANMSHELRTPLNAILGYSDILQRDLSINDNQKESLAIIHRSSNHLLCVVNDVLELAKIEAGHIQLEMAPFDVAAVIAEVSTMLQLRSQEKGLQLSVNLSEQFPRYMISDEDKFKQILINLISNAINATEHGNVTLNGRVAHDDGEVLIIEVSDTGIGIAPDDQTRIFEPFVQIGATTRQQGTGLGLSITRQFVELMGGHLSLSSSLGQGSTFSVELPCQRASAADILQPDSDYCEVTGLAAGQPDIRVLVVDDHRENQLLLAQWLETTGFHVALAENGAEAVEQFKRWQPHFIWMDRRMPVMDGVEAVRRIRALPDGRNVRIAAVTASILKDDDDALLAAGFDAIVHKPFRRQSIFECMGQLLNLSYEHATTNESPEALRALSGTALAALPARLRNSLSEAILRLDQERILEVIGEIATFDGELAEGLRERVRHYAYPIILSLLQTMPATEDQAPPCP